MKVLAVVVGLYVTMVGLEIAALLYAGRALGYSLPAAHASHFECPGGTWGTVRVKHWYIVRVADTTPKHRLVYALCGDGSYWQKYDAKQTRRKIIRIAQWFYHPTGLGWAGGDMDWIALEVRGEIRTK